MCRNGVTKPENPVILKTKRFRPGKRMPVLNRYIKAIRGACAAGPPLVSGKRQAPASGLFWQRSERRLKAMKVVIVGGVAGGAGTAARLRRLDENAEIIMLERGE